MRSIVLVAALLVATAVSGTVATGSERIALLDPQHHSNVAVDLPPMKIAKKTDVAEVGFEAAATVMLHESLFKKLVASVLPTIIADAKGLKIPGQKSKHFSFSTIELSAFNIASFTIGFAAPNQVVIDLQGLTLAVPETDFDVFTKILFVHASCGGYFKVNVDNTNIRVTFDMTEADGHLVISDGVASVDFGGLSVYHHFHSFVCRVGQDIIQLFVGNIDNLIRNLVEKDISPIATKAINAIFAKMAGKVSIPLVAQPVATADSIELSLNLLPPNAAKQGRRASSGRRAATVSAFPSRDIEVFVTESTVNALLAHFQSIGHLNIHDVLKVNTSVFKTLLPAAYAACPDCPLEVTTDFQRAPTATFAGESASLSFASLIAGISGVHAGNGTAIPLVDLNLNGTGGLVNWTIGGNASNVIDFKLAIPSFTMTLERSAIGPVDVAALQGLVDWLLQKVVVPDFNEKFHGLPVPPIADITIDDMVVSFAGAADFGLDIVVPTA